MPAKGLAWRGAVAIGAVVALAIGYVCALSWACDSNCPPDWVASFGNYLFWAAAATLIVLAVEAAVRLVLRLFF